MANKLDKVVLYNNELAPITTQDTSFTHSCEVV